MHLYAEEAGIRAVAVLGRKDKSAWAVYVIIAAKVNVDGYADPGPGQRLLATLTGYATGTVSDALERLQLAGLLEYERGKGPGNASRYFLPWVPEYRQEHPLRLIHKRAVQDPRAEISTSARSARGSGPRASARSRAAPKEVLGTERACETCAGTGWVPMSDAPRAPVVRCADCSDGWTQAR